MSEPKYKDRADWLLHEPLRPKPVKNSELSPEKRRHVTELRKRLLKEGVITQEQFEVLENEE